ncbi:CAP-associated domain-containing protein [Ammoniphilus sp. CFH 90114]|uniref:CAP domain-containing protein n=1 Tax=Ammoniphilus sp. CFH 90114 TaxID=2493665 RepID=UPI0013E98C7A|nr:CAP-associated domain-containing protein [Ammoniphilus sp. CFH 90114]
MKSRILWILLSCFLLVVFSSCAHAERLEIKSEKPSLSNGQGKTDEWLAKPEEAGKDQGIYGIHLGLDAKEVRQKLGEPDRKDLSLLGYEWWIYNKSLDKYIQVGMKENKVVDLYSPVSSWKYKSVQEMKLESKVSFSYDRAKFTLENQVEERPLAWLEDHAVIFYLDRHNQQKISGIRFMEKDLVVKSRTYALSWSYSGQAPKVEGPILTASEERQAREGLERQILDLVNVTRSSQGLHPLLWNEQAAKVARAHSKDMLSNQYFDHISATTGLSPFDRLKKQGVKYRMAGENIAAGYRDAIEVHHGWMNSLGHRQNILQADFTTLGVGVEGEYFTQKFVTP